MTEFDKQYLELVKKILKEGIEVENRTGINTIKIPNHTFTFDLREDFPILTLKNTAWKNAIIEMLWIWQMASNDVRDLHERGVHIWDEWMIDSDGIYRIYEPVTKMEDFNKDKEVVVLDPMTLPLDDPLGAYHEMGAKHLDNGLVMTAKSVIPGKNIKKAIYYGKDLAYTIGKAYGFYVDRYGLTRSTLYKLLNNPYDRRKVNDLWQMEFLREAVLPSCVFENSLDVTGDKLSMIVNQRSCDVPLGLPFNVTQYATFLSMLAKVSNLEANKLIYVIQDAHIYKNQLEGMKELLRRASRYEELSKYSKDELLYLELFTKDKINNLDIKDPNYKILDTDLRIIDMILNPDKPELWLNPSINDFYDFDNSKELKDVKVRKYRHMGTIKMPVAQ